MIKVLSWCFILCFSFAGLGSKEPKKVKVRVANVSLNQTVYDYARNVENHLDAIDMAVKDKADIISFQELSLTGYAADDYHKWNKDNDAVLRQIKYIAEYANKKDPNLILSIGAPFHYKNEGRKASDSRYNIDNKLYNTQMFITGGKIVAISAKTILADGPTEYEPRQFIAWPMGVQPVMIDIPGQKDKVPFGKPLVNFGKNKQYVTFFHEQCAEGWPGLNDKGGLNTNDEGARYISTFGEKAKETFSLVINASASRPQPAINKEQLRIDGLAKKGSQYCGAYVYTNYLGSESGAYAAEGSQIFAQNGELVHHGRRYSFKNVSYSSANIDLPVKTEGWNKNPISHEFKTEENSIQKAIDGQIINASFFDFQSKKTGNDLVYEEYMRSVALWLRDYLEKQSWGPQGYLVSLSGGADSAYGAVAVAMMIELSIEEEGIEGFFKRFPRLTIKDKVLKIYNESPVRNKAQAIDLIKKHMLTCVYLPTDNSGPVTLNAAKTLIEGGFIEKKTNGGVVEKEYVKGIGGTFVIHNVQGPLDAYLLTHAGLNTKKMEQAVEELKTKEEYKRLDAVGKVIHDTDLKKVFYEGGMEAIVKNDIKKYMNAPLNSNPKLPEYISKMCVRDIPTWADKKNDLTLQNYQARTRVAVPWAIANQDGLIPLVTSNASEAALGYTTAGGDMHMGGANPIGGIPKSTLKYSLEYLQKHGLVGLKPIPALHYITVQTPTAELRKQVDGEKPQTDEGDLGFSYEQSEAMERTLLTEKKTPIEAFVILMGMKAQSLSDHRLAEIQAMSAENATVSKNNLFPTDEASTRTILVKFGTRWAANQFKRIMGPLAPYLGDNFDPHLSLRTTVLGDHFTAGLALLTYKVLFNKDVPPEIKGIIERSKALKTKLIAWTIPTKEEIENLIKTEQERESKRNSKN
jgi:NH3-dependent NAD+ synthetase